MLADYILAFSVLGLSGVFRNKGFKGVIAGTYLAVFLRFLCHLFSGAYIFNSVGKIWEGFETANPWVYSLFYNGCYMLPEFIMTAIVAALLYKVLENNKL